MDLPIRVNYNGITRMERSLVAMAVNRYANAANPINSVLVVDQESIAYLPYDFTMQCLEYAIKNGLPFSSEAMNAKLVEIANKLQGVPA